MSSFTENFFVLSLPQMAMFHVTLMVLLQVIFGRRCIVLCGLQVNPVGEQSGFARIHLFNTEIANLTNTIVHIINPYEIGDIINQLENNINNIDIYNKDILKSEIRIIKTKIKSITPLDNLRSKRGLLNAVGSIYKWGFGLMDEEDRQEVLEHLKTTEENSHNAIQTLHQQISINNHLNDSITILKETIEKDRTKIAQSFREIKNRNSEIVKHLLYNDQMLKLRYLENKINIILDSIASARNGIAHPSILTSEEIEKFQIDFIKLKLIRVGIMLDVSNCIVIAIKIPKNYISVEVLLVTPIPNREHFQIVQANELIVTINERQYTYDKNILIKELKPATNCVYRNTCKLEFNNRTEVEYIDDETILVKNAISTEITQDCDNRTLTLNGNYILSFGNCKIIIGDNVYFNKKTEIRNTFFYPTNNVNLTVNETISFEKISMPYFENIKEIRELKYHRNVSYGISTGLFLFLLGISIALCLKCKYRKTKRDVGIKIEMTSTADIAKVEGDGAVQGAVQ